MKSSKIFSDSMRVGFANYASHAIGALISIILAKWLGPADFGIFSIGFFVLTIFGTGLNGLDQTYVHFAVRTSQKKQEFFATYCTAKITISVFIILGYAILIFLLGSLKFSTSRSTIILCGLIGGLGMQLLTIILSFFQAQKNFYHYSLAKLAYYVGLLFCVLLGIQFDIKRLHYYLLTYIGSSIIIFIFKKCKISFVGFNSKIVGRFWKFGKWLIMYHLLRMLNMRLDFFWLSKFYSGEILGQYSAALKLVNIFAVLIGTFPVLLLPEASSMKTIKDLEKYWVENKKIIIFLLISWVLIFVFSPFVIKFLLGPEYEQSISIMLVLLFSLLPQIFVLSLIYIFLAMGKTVYLFLITVIQTIALSVTVPLLIKKTGMIGSAYGKVISFVLTFIIYFLVYKFRKKQFYNKLVKKNRS